MYELFFSDPGREYTRTEQNIINYILEHPETCIQMSIGTLAQKTGSSEPTISRLARHCGYRDFKELKAAMTVCVTDSRSPADKLLSSMECPDTSSPEGMLRYQQYCIEKTSREAAVLLDYQKQTGYPVIFLTSRIKEPEPGRRIIPLYIYRGEPTEYHSMAAPCALIDALVLLTGQQLGDAPKESLSRLYHLKEHYRSDIPR